MGLFSLLVLSAAIAFVDHQDASFYPLLISSGITLAAALGCILFTNAKQRIDLKAGYFIVTGCWVAACLFGALPFFLYGHEFNFVNSLLRASRVSPLREHRS